MCGGESAHPVELVNLGHSMVTDPWCEGLTHIKLVNSFAALERHSGTITFWGIV